MPAHTLCPQMPWWTMSHILSCASWHILGQWHMLGQSLLHLEVLFLKTRVWWLGWPKEEWETRPFLRWYWMEGSHPPSYSKHSSTMHTRLLSLTSGALTSSVLSRSTPESNLPPLSAYSQSTMFSIVTRISHIIHSAVSWSASKWNVLWLFQWIKQCNRVLPAK